MVYRWFDLVFEYEGIESILASTLVTTRKCFKLKSSPSQIRNISIPDSFLKEDGGFELFTGLKFNRMTHYSNQ